MNILVLGGSPKGERSVTMKHVEYLRLRYPDHAWTLVQCASRIAVLEKGGAELEAIAEAARKADLVLWAFPLYYLTVCSQFKRFVELVEAKGLQGAFAGKHAAILTTSIHFYDHPAHVYIREVSEDWGLRFAASLSCSMQEMLKPAGRARLDAFAQTAFAAVAADRPSPRRSAPLPAPSASPAGGLDSLSAPQPSVAAAGAKVVVLADYLDGPAGAMARRFAASFGPRATLVDLGTLGLEKGCLGCMRCADRSECVYEGKDDFTGVYRELVEKADILAYAVTVRDRGLSSRWKAFLDRSFFRNHQQTLKGKRLAVLAAGPLSRLGNLQEILETVVERHGATLSEMVSDEASSAPELAALIDAVAARTAELPAAAPQPETFRGIAGAKLFRDEIFGGMRIIFRADHRDYKRNGAYDFPLRNPLKRFGVWAVYWLVALPPAKKFMREGMTKNMLMPYGPVLKATKPLA